MKSNNLLSTLTVLMFFQLGINTIVRTQPQQAAGKADKQNPLPVLIGKGVLSTDDAEFGPAFSSDGSTCVFVKKNPSTLSSSVVVICVSYFKDGRWTAPEIAPFSGQHLDLNPCFSPDGSKLYFLSNRPYGEKKGPDTDIWFVEKSPEGWGESQSIGAPVNSSGWELGCSVTADGTIYYSSTDSTGNADLYCSRLVEGKYQTPVKLDAAVNTEFTERDPFIAPDESYLLFSSNGRPDALTGPGVGVKYPRSDLYISYHRNGAWSAAQNLGRPINSDAEETNPSVSRDGETLYFASERSFVSVPMATRLNFSSLEKFLHSAGNGLSDIYEVAAEAVLKGPQ
jgi:Tol biopolymer transport system component